jgi:L-ascorbate metabolism protein UlaG (beta-lactamase superfamily)
VVIGLHPLSGMRAPIRRLLAAVGLAALLLAGACAHARPPPEHVQVPTAAFAADPDAITISWVGHATVLIGIAGHWFLTDPVFSERLARLYPRKVAATIRPDELPPLDAILISHAHFDHLDLPSLRRLPDAPLLVPPGVRGLLPGDLPMHQVIALDTWQTWTAGDVRITAVPASHGDGRYGIDLWRRHAHTGWMITVGDRTVYFAGDTGYVPAQATALAHRFAIDVALIPVGPAGRAKWIERWRAKVHATPDAALALFRASGARFMVPIHYGTFFGSPDRERPLVVAAIARAGLTARVRPIQIGATTMFSSVALRYSMRVMMWKPYVDSHTPRCPTSRRSDSCLNSITSCESGATGIGLPLCAEPASSEDSRITSSNAAPASSLAWSSVTSASASFLVRAIARGSIAPP